MTEGGPVRRVVLALACALVVAFGLPSLAQSDTPNPIEEFISAVTAPDNAEWVSQFLRPPAEGTGAFSDPVGDIGHSTGDPAGYGPDHIDIIDTWAVDIDLGEFPLGPISDDGLFRLGQNETPLPSDRVLWTYGGEMPHDGSQFADGAWLFGMTTLALPPSTVPGRCEFVVWINDPGLGVTWENRPAFPDDPAGGTNSAYGIGYNPDGTSGTFTLQLSPEGFFQSVPDIDVRGFVIDDYTGILIPKQVVPSIAAINFYTFCVEEGFSFAPEDTGSDQTGLILVDQAVDFGIAQLLAQSTTTTTEATTTTTAAPTTTIAPTTSTTAAAPVAAGGFPWGLVLGGGIVLMLLGWFLYNLRSHQAAALSVNTRRIGIASMAVGGVLTVVGAMGMLSGGDQAVDTPVAADSTTTTEPPTTSTTEPTTTVSSSTTTQATSTTEPPTTSTTTLPDPADVDTFVNQFVAWIAAADTDALVGRLHPVVIEEYGADLCREFVGREILALENYRSTGSVSGPDASQFGSVDIDVYRVPVAFTFQGEEFTSDATFAFVDGTVHWFATCR